MVTITWNDIGRKVRLTVGTLMIVDSFCVDLSEFRKEAIYLLRGVDVSGFKYHVTSTGYNIEGVHDVEELLGVKLTLHDVGRSVLGTDGSVLRIDGIQVGADDKTPIKFLLSSGHCIREDGTEVSTGRVIATEIL